MEENSVPLLSVIIPTKNRQKTCLYAIESVTMIQKEDVEIIVQDCSDGPELGQQISSRFGADKRIKYEHLDSQPSMTENWNRAFERATGIYQCGIGDDDVVLPNIYEIATWAKTNKIDAVGHSKKYNYFWPDFTIIKGYASKLIKVFDDLPEAVITYERSDLDKILATQAALPNMNYRNLPIAYHTLLAGKLIDTLRIRTGTFLDGTSLDVYSGFALGLLVNNYYVFDKPFTLPGACGSSNSNRATTKKASEHFAEFKNITFDERIPPVFNLTFSIAESTQKALSNLGDTKFSKLLDLPYLYVGYMAHSFSLNTLKSLLKFMKKQNFTLGQYFRFAWLLAVRISSFIFMKSNLIFTKLTPMNVKPKPAYPAADIAAAARIIS